MTSETPLYGAGPPNASKSLNSLENGALPTHIEACFEGAFELVSEESPFQGLLSQCSEQLVDCQRKKTTYLRIELCVTVELSRLGIRGSIIVHNGSGTRSTWLYARRHFEDMPPEREQIVVGYKPAGVDEMVLFDFAFFAHKLGFRTTEIEKLLQDQFHFEDIKSSISVITGVIETAGLVSNNQAVNVDEHEPRPKHEASITLKQREVEQVIRLESLAANERKHYARNTQLEQSRADVGGEIRLDRVTTTIDQPTEDDDVSETERLLQVSAQLSEKQNELNRLEGIERNKRLVIRQLEEEEVRLRSSIHGLSITVRALTEDEQAKVDSIASPKEQQHSTNNKLVEKEMRLRQNIDLLEVCRERLEADIKAATEEKDILSHALLAEKQIVNSTDMRGGSQDIDELRSDANLWRTYH
ncbi:uncharacterized protein BBA_07423 [Beauveria bassiana ARSEF 2860]|uniref:Uncharacterized protein n=1 Tax=Beauveria bassiana (strain ARSEF 2860) TaxID=655819 RepID=J4UIP7_BEAB2|nr:uncharacterized protein BBA_07423 [Beauveria bassiana ARSEF 2860]EJP63497.1 hypothetical protein BBA_07423 [Beauveria bassiana ARSEF 2860]